MDFFQALEPPPQVELPKTPDGAKGSLAEVPDPGSPVSGKLRLEEPKQDKSCIGR